MAPAPPAVAWQFALVSRLVFPVSPELHPAITGADESASAAAAKAQPASKAIRCRCGVVTAFDKNATRRLVLGTAARSRERMFDMVVPGLRPRGAGSLCSRDATLVSGLSLGHCPTHAAPRVSGRAAHKAAKAAGVLAKHWVRGSCAIFTGREIFSKAAAAQSGGSQTRQRAPAHHRRLF